MSKEKEIEELLTRNVEEILVKKDLESQLKGGKKLTIYYGVDPSGPIIHLGHAVVLRKLKQFQDLGHKIIFLVGDFTGMIGDPTDKGAARQPLTREQVLENAKTYKEQLEKIIDFKGRNSAEFRFNSEWNDKLDFREIIQLSHHFTVQQLLERDMFQERIKKEKPIHLHEFLYPLIQGYDAVVLEADVQVAGTDQTFNMLAGRHLNKTLKNKTNTVLSCPLLEGTDGRKMSKSFGNVIGVTDSADDMFGKMMSIKDELIIRYFELCTDRTVEEIKEITRKLKAGENPRNIKFELAKDIVTIYHSSKEAEKAAKEFEQIFKNKEKPTEMPKAKYMKGSKLVDVLVESNTVSSKSDARRLIQQKAVKDNDKVITDIDYKLEKGNHTVQVGKRRFIELSEK